MNDLFKDIKEFHEKFGLEYNGYPKELNDSVMLYRMCFMLEELNEYIASVHKHDLEGAFDALIDLVYVALGTAYFHGFPFNEGWKLVHEANMKKIRTAHKGHSKRNSEFDIIKPEGWEAPDLSELIRRKKLDE